MEEKILLSIEIQKPEGEKEVDALTRKISDLQIATANLQKQNNELIKAGKQNSQEYVENTRQIELNKQKITEATATRKGLIQTLVAEENSIKSLRVRNAELIKQRDLLNTSTEEGRIKIAQINAELDKNNATIKENVSAQEKQRLGVGGYVEALDKLVPGLGATVKGIQDATKAALLFIATPLGLVIAALGAAIFALTSYFKGSEEGQNRLNKIIAVGSAIFEQFMNIVEDVGETIYEAFTNPQQAAKDLLNFLQAQFVNRIVGIIDLIPNLAKAVEQVFKGNFAEAGKIAVDAVAKVGLGIENATEKFSDFIDSTTELVNKGIENGQRLAEFQAKIDKDSRKLLVDREKTSLEVSKLRAEALKFEGDERKKILLEAIALEETLSKREVELTKLRLANAELLRDANGDDKEALDAVAQARAAVFAAEATAFSNTLRFRKEIAAIDEATAKEQAKLLEEANAMVDKAHQEELARIEREKQAILELQELRLEEEILRALTIEERVNKEIELEQFKTLALLENQNLLESERQLIIEKGQANINAIIVKGTQDRAKKELEAEKKLADEKKKLQQQERQGREASADAAISLAREVFGKNKAVAAAEVVVNTIRGVTRALADYIFPYSVIVAGIVGALGAVQIAKIAGVQFAKGGLLIRKLARGGITRTGGVLRGPLHRDGGIPFTVGGRPGFEAEGGEAIINRRSTSMFRKELSAINQAGGGVAFKRGGIATYQTGSIITGNQTRQASSVAESRSAIQDAVLLAIQNMPPTIVSVVDINERSAEVEGQVNKAQVI